MKEDRIKHGLWVLVLVIHKYCFLGEFDAHFEGLPFWLRLPSIVGGLIGFTWHGVLLFQEQEAEATVLIDSQRLREAPNIWGGRGGLN